MDEQGCTVTPEVGFKVLCGAKDAIYRAFAGQGDSPASAVSTAIVGYKHALAEINALREERDRLRVSLKGSELDVAEAQDERLGLESVLSMAVSRLGGNVEGKPTHRMNFLQRIDALRSIEHQHSMRALRKIQVTAMGPVLACPEGLAEHRKADYHQPYEHCPVTIRRQQARLAEAEALLREIKETDAAAIAELDDLGFSSTGVDRTLVDKVQAFLAAGKGGDDG